MSTKSRPKSPLRILIFALGGEGGGVLMNWIVDAARASGLKAQATSVPGVAQRTGSTSYYIEIAQGQGSLLSLLPMPGRVDVLVASELVEAARAIELGYVSPTMTTLIASTNRVFATAEKIDMGDGRFDSARIIQAARKISKKTHLLDFDQIAQDHGTLISATLFGAIAASGVLPVSREKCEAAIGQTRSAESSRKGFAAAYEAVIRPSDTSGEKPQVQVIGAAALEGFAAIPEPLREVTALGHERASDFQDAAYGELFMERVGRIVSSGTVSDHRVRAAMEEAIRRMALWMAYEDVARVAELKTRPARFARIRDEVKLTPGQIIKVTEYLRPRAEEVADILPARIGRAIMARVQSGRTLPFLGKPIRLRSNGILGYWLLRSVASLRHTRRGSLRFATEQAAIEQWLSVLCDSMAANPGFAEALATLPRVRKGYSDTMERGLRAYERIFRSLVTPAVGRKPDAADLRKAIAAALADDTHVQLDEFLAGRAS